MPRERFGAELIGMFVSPPKFIYVVKCWGLVKGMGVLRERVRAEFIGMFF